MPTRSPRMPLLAILAVAAMAPVSRAQEQLGDTPYKVLMGETRMREFADHTRDLLSRFDLSNPQISWGWFFSPGAQPDQVSAISKPARAPAKDAPFPPATDIVIEVVVEGQAVAYPLALLTYHQAINDEINGVPVAAVYCPLCDAVTVVDRRVEHEGETKTLEFGVSGLLAAGNAVLFDRNTKGLWSQASGRALTGPMAGARLNTLPFRTTTFADFKRVWASKDGEVVQKPSGSEMPYDQNIFAGYQDAPDLLYVPVSFDRRLPPKTLGVGIAAEDFTLFVPMGVFEEEEFTAATPLGPVTLASGPAGPWVKEAPKEAFVAQSFYANWFSLYPKSTVQMPVEVRELPPDAIIHE